MPTLQAKDLSLSEVHRLLGLQRQPTGTFTDHLTLEALTPYEQQELQQIRIDFEHYWLEGKVTEGMVKALTVLPLLRLAGFYRAPLKISLEEEIAQIVITDEDTMITGRFDILAVNKTQSTAASYFWVLVIEAKNSTIDPIAGLPQLLTYASSSLANQSAVWGLVTNGSRYQFVYLQQNEVPTYQLMPFLTLMEAEPARQILQVLKAIGR